MMKAMGERERETCSLQDFDSEADFVPDHVGADSAARAKDVPVE